MEDLSKVLQGGINDLEVVCQDGRLQYPKLVGGLVFPGLAVCSVLENPIAHTLLVPDYTTRDVQGLVNSVLTQKSIVGFLEVKEGDENNVRPVPAVDVLEKRPFTCSVCPTSFKTRTSWKNHAVTHRKIRTRDFSCYHCHKRFLWEKDCRRHLKRNHGVVIFDRKRSIKTAKTCEKSKVYQTLSSNVFKMKIQLVENTMETKKDFHDRKPITKIGLGPMPLGKKAINENALKNPDLIEELSVVEEPCSPNSTESSLWNQEFSLWNHNDNGDDNINVIDTEGKGTENFKRMDEKSLQEVFSAQKSEGNGKCPENSKGMAEMCGLKEKALVIKSRGRPPGSKNKPKVISEENPVPIKHETEKPSDEASITYSLPENCKISKNISVDIFIPTIAGNLTLEPKLARDLFLDEKRFKCGVCLRKFANSPHLKKHNKTCMVPLDSPYQCTVCTRRFISFSLLQLHWKLNHNRQEMV